MSDQKTNPLYIILITMIVIFSWLIHEFAHWITSEIFGYDTIMTLNTIRLNNVVHRKDWHGIIISAAGPIITLSQAIIAFIILQTRGWNKYLYPFLFVAFYMRSLAGIMNFINPNDEGRISSQLGIGTFTFPIIVSGLLFYMVYYISKKYGLRWRFQTITTLVVMIVSSVLILADQFFQIRIL